MSEHANRVFWRCLFEIAGLPRNPTMPCPHPSKKDMSLAVGWPDLQLGLAYSADPKVVSAFKSAGWVVHEFPAEMLNHTVPFLDLLANLTVDTQVRGSVAGAKHNVSKEENRLLTALLKAGLPEPDRNHTITTPKGQSGTPDLVWIDQKLAVFVDGLFHHRGRDRMEIIKAAAEDPEVARQLERSENTRATKDAALRRHMTTDGWTVIEVADTELGDEDSIGEIAFEIVTAWRHLN